MRYRVIDERKTVQAASYPLSVAARPFTVQTKSKAGWGTVPGAYFATKQEAKTFIQENRKK